MKTNVFLGIIEVKLIHISGIKERSLPFAGERRFLRQIDCLNPERVLNNGIFNPVGDYH